MGAWVKQIASHIAKFGPKKASWYCEWDEPNGGRRCKSCGAGSNGKKLAEQMAKHIRAEILTCTYSRSRDREKTWDTFQADYVTRIVAAMSFRSQTEVKTALKHFRDEMKLGNKPVRAITTRTIDEFRYRMRKKRGKKRNSLISPATINKDLRHIKTALRKAYKWGYLDVVPHFTFEREPKTLPRYVTPEHFTAIYEACDVATFPSEMHVPAAGWWRALLVFAQMTGWRISEILALEWSDVDLNAATAITRARDNKGKRDEMVVLHSVVIEHVRSLRGFHRNVFPSEDSREGDRALDRKRLTKEFHAIQEAAGIDLACRATGKTASDLKNNRADATRGHICTVHCHRYGFHDLRRAFATMNAANMSREALQALMRHQSSMTTEKYINFAQQMKPAVAKLHVPEILRDVSVG